MTFHGWYSKTDDLNGKAKVWSRIDGTEVVVTTVSFSDDYPYDHDDEGEVEKDEEDNEESEENQPAGTVYVGKVAKYIRDATQEDKRPWIVEI